MHDTTFDCDGINRSKRLKYGIILIIIHADERYNLMKLQKILPAFSTEVHVGFKTVYYNYSLKGLALPGDVHFLTDDHKHTDRQMTEKTHTLNNLLFLTHHKRA